MTWRRAINLFKRDAAMLADLLSLLWTGLISGCLYALGAIGIVLIYKSSNVVNFAHGNIAGIAAFLVFGLTGGVFAKLPWGVAVAVTLVIVMAIAVLAYVFIAPLVFKSDLTATVATLGVGLIIQGATQLLFGASIVSLDLPLPHLSFNLPSLHVTSYDLAVLAITLLLILALHLIIDRTRIGVAFRAVSISPFASRVCGLDLRRIHLFSWMSAAVLAFAAALLIVPTTFLSSTTVNAFMLQAFVAATIGGFSSLPGAVVGGILIGVFVNLLSFYVSSEFNNTFLLIAMLTVLNLFPRGLFTASGGARV